MERKINQNIITKVKKVSKQKEIPNYAVILLNDTETTMNFVVSVIIKIFHKNTAEANELMMKVHQNGEAVIGIYSHDIAVTKADQVHAEARKNNFPLHCIVKLN